MPFVAGALYFNPPIAFISLIPAYVVGKYNIYLVILANSSLLVNFRGRVGFFIYYHK